MAGQGEYRAVGDWSGSGDWCCERGLTVAARPAGRVGLRTAGGGSTAGAVQRDSRGGQRRLRGLGGWLAALNASARSDARAPLLCQSTTSPAVYGKYTPLYRKCNPNSGVIVRFPAGFPMLTELCRLQSCGGTMLGKGVIRPEEEAILHQGYSPQARLSSQTMSSTLGTTAFSSGGL